MEESGNTSHKWQDVASELRLTQLDHLERDGVHIQCLNSTDFVLGKQTNFNGPVTIISCAQVLKERTFSPSKEEEMIIEDRVLSPSAAKKFHKISTSGKPLEGAHGDSATATSTPFLKVSPCCISHVKPTSRKCLVTLLLCLVLFAVALIAVPLFATTTTGTDQPEISTKCELVSNNTCIYSGFAWGGRPAPAHAKPLTLPVPFVVISQTQDGYCYEYDACLEILEEFQLNGTEAAACNFLVGGDGNAYEDYGWAYDSRPRGPLAGKTLRICFMGHFEDDYPTYPQVEAAKALVQGGVERKYVAADYALLPSNATTTDEELDSIYRIIKKWPRFLETLLL